MSKTVGATGNQPSAVQAARDFLDSGGSAVGAVLSGFFLDAGKHSGVLLGPLIVVVAGIGNGVRVFDGRLRQPGLGTKRPRGFTQDAEIPMGARVAVPQAIAAAVVAHAYEGTDSFADVLKRGIRQARQSGAEARASVLESIRAQGARCISSPHIARPLLHVAGVSEGGLLTYADLASVASLDFTARAHQQLPDWAVVPWAGDVLVQSNCASGDETPVDFKESTDAFELVRYSRAESLVSTMLLCAVDARGIFAGASYQHVIRGVFIEELELDAPMSAIPVRRGVPRMSPGSCLPASAPMAVQTDRGVAISIVGDSKFNYLASASIMSPQFRIQRHPETRRVIINELLPDLRECKAPTDD